MKPDNTDHSLPEPGYETTEQDIANIRLSIQQIKNGECQEAEAAFAEIRVELLKRLSETKPPSKNGE